ncbi:hypothetical protein H6F67_14220 [Microcoleus sp. FACHB-1515]|nr:hypothetical protein [Microcoleus sp. FACHB-1515]MBD2091007.1 hypothetical protein [Microcoleus sp. FACHB-1515]
MLACTHAHYGQSSAWIGRSGVPCDELNLGKVKGDRLHGRSLHKPEIKRW